MSQYATKIDPLGSPYPMFTDEDGRGILAMGPRNAPPGESLMRLHLWNRPGMSIGHELPESQIRMERRDPIYQFGVQIGWGDWYASHGLPIEARVDDGEYVSIDDLRIPPIASGEKRLIEIRVAADAPTISVDLRMVVVYGERNFTPLHRPKFSP